METAQKFSLFLVAVTVFAATTSITEAINYQQETRIREFNNECKTESHVEQKLIDDARKGFFSTDPTFKTHIFCFSKKAELQDVHGVFQLETLRKRLQVELGDENQVTDIIEKCVKINADPEDTAFETLRCLQDTVPNGTVYF